MLPEFLVYYIISPLGQKIVHAGKVEAARANISLGDLRNLSIPLPPLAEQSSAVLFVKQVREKLTHFERAQQKNDSELQCLEHSILHKAFRGEL